MKFFMVLLLTAVVASGCSGKQKPALEPLATAEASPTQGAVTAPEVLVPVQSPLVKSNHAPGSRLDADYAVVFINATNGSLEVWTLREGLANDRSVWLQPSRDGQIIALQVGGEPIRRYVVRRDTGEAFELANDWVPDISVGYGNVIGAWRGTDGADFGLLDLESGKFLATDIDRDRLADSSRLSRPDGKAFVVGDGAEFRLVDAATGLSKVVKSDIPGYRAIASYNGNGFSLVARAGNGTPYHFDWDGRPTSDTGRPGLSPDGKFQAISSSPGRLNIQYGMGAFPQLNVTTLLDATTGRPVARLLGAAFREWSADGRAMMIGDNTPDNLIVALDGTTVFRLPYGGLTQGSPQFSPRNADLVTTHRGIVNFRSGESWLMVLQDQMSGSGRWKADGSEAVFWVQPTPGKGGGVAVELFPLKFEAAPFEANVRLAVEAGGDCLNLRDSAKLEAPVLGCLADGSVLSFEPVLLHPRRIEEPLEEFIGLRDENSRTWISVRTADGVAGWVDAEFVGWAP